MHLYEWAGKELLRAAEIHVPAGRLARTPEEALAACEALGGTAVLKAQVRRGGRGKAGLIRTVHREETAAVAAWMLSQHHAGEPVAAVLVEERVQAEAEWYVAVAMDDVAGKPVMLASLSGGVDVEAGPVPPARLVVDPRRGLRRHEAAALWRETGLRGPTLREAAAVSVNLYRMFVASDALLAEINPLFASPGRPPVAGDIKLLIDDNSLFRHPRWQADALADPGWHPLERKAAALGITYVDLDGEIAVLSGGAGATMALLDAIHHCGGRPANFLDARGGSGTDTMRQMVDLVLEKAETDARVRVMLLHVTLSGTSLHSFVDAVVAAFAARPPRVPAYGCIWAAGAAVHHLSLREGVAILREHGVHVLPDLRQAVQAAVAAARGAC